MQESDYISEIGLVIAYKKHIVFGKFFQLFRAADPKFVNDRDAGIGNDSNNHVNQLPDNTHIFQTIAKLAHTRSLNQSYKTKDKKLIKYRRGDNR